MASLRVLTDFNSTSINFKRTLPPESLPPLIFARCSVVVQCLTEQRLNNERTTTKQPSDLQAGNKNDIGTLKGI